MAKSKSPQSAAPALMLETLSGSAQATQLFGERVGRALRPGDVVALYGELGTGKTIFVQGIARGQGRDQASIKSPTFVLVREYPGETMLVHVDGYRLDGPPSAAWLDLDLIFSPRRVTLIEWAERFEGLLPEQALIIHVSHVSANRRRFVVASNGTRAAEILTQLQASPMAAAEQTHDTPGD